MWSLLGTERSEKQLLKAPVVANRFGISIQIYLRCSNVSSITELCATVSLFAPLEGPDIAVVTFQKQFQGNQILSFRLEIDATFCVSLTLC